MSNSFLKWLSTIFCILRRTHSQISQVIREYRKTAYRVPMAVLVCLPIPCHFMFYNFLGIVQREFLLALLVPCCHPNLEGMFNDAY
jgi:hypothetical protein